VGAAVRKGGKNAGKGMRRKSKGCLRGSDDTESEDNNIGEIQSILLNEIDVTNRPFRHSRNFRFFCFLPPQERIPRAARW